MTTSKLEIWNQALSELGTRSTITDLAEDSPEANQCRLNYDTARLQLLRSAHWDFARKTATAVLNKAAPGTPENTDPPGAWTSAWPAPPWLYSYVYPSDCVLNRAVMGQPYLAQGFTVPIFSAPTGAAEYGLGQAVRWLKAADTTPGGTKITSILTNQEDALLVYTYDCDDVNQFDAMFCNTMQVALASEICNALTGNGQLQTRLEAKLAMQIAEARVANGNEGITILDHQPDWMRVHGWSAGQYAMYRWAEPFFGWV